VLSFPSGMTVSSRALGVLSDALRAATATSAAPGGASSRRRKLPPGRQALLVVAHLRKGETYADWPADSRSGPRRSTATSAAPVLPREVVAEGSRRHGAGPANSTGMV
jgi:hypothetical protein